MSEMAQQLIRQAKAEGWKRLDLGNTGIVGEVPAEIWALEELEELILSKSWSERGKRLQKSHNTGPENKISAFPEPPSLHKKDAVSGDKTAHDTSLGLGRLTKLFLEDPHVADIQPLAQLSQLQELSLNYTQVADIQPLAQLSNLGHLHLDRTQVADIQPLAQLHSLQELSLDGTKVKFPPQDIQDQGAQAVVQYLQQAPTA